MNDNDKVPAGPRTKKPLEDTAASPPPAGTTGKVKSVLIVITQFFCFSHKKQLLRFTIDHDNIYTIRSILKPTIVEKNLKTIFDILPTRLYFIDSLFCVGDFSHLNLCIQSGEALPEVPTLRPMCEKCFPTADRW